jgi:hypothetical protein
MSKLLVNPVPGEPTELLVQDIVRNVKVTRVSFSFSVEQDWQLERTKLSRVKIRTDYELQKEPTNVLSTFKASLELGGIVRGRDLVFLSSTTETAHLLRDSSGSRDCAFFKSILVPRERKRSCLHCCCLLLTEGEKVLGFLQQLAGVCPRDNQLLDIGQLIQ